MSSRVGVSGAEQNVLKRNAHMKSRLYKMVTGAAALLAMIPSVSAGVPNPDTRNAFELLPDGGASILLLAIGCSGLALAARKRFKR
jgi:hypothetical protein